MNFIGTWADRVQRSIKYQKIRNWAVIPTRLSSSFITIKRVLPSEQLLLITPTVIVKPLTFILVHVSLNKRQARANLLLVIEVLWSEETEQC